LNHVVVATVSIISHFIFIIHDAAHSVIYNLSLHDALPILGVTRLTVQTAYSALQEAGWIESTVGRGTFVSQSLRPNTFGRALARSEEHTSELQSRENLVCRLLLEIK